MSAGKYQLEFGATDAGYTSTINKVKDSTKSLDATVAKTSEKVKDSFNSIKKSGDSVAATSEKINASFASMVKAGAALALGFGAIKLAASAVSNTFGTFRDALDLGGELSDLSDATGETSGNLLVLQRAFDNSGIGADKVGTSINKMQKVLVDAAAGSEEAQEKFSNLGLSWSEMATKSPTEQLQMLAAAISQLPTPAERAAASMEFFGKSGGRTLAFLRDFDGAIENAKRELGTMPDIMDKNARTFDTISDKITVIGGKFKEFAAGMLSEMTPMLEAVATGLAAIDTAAIGKRIGEIFIGGTAAMDGFTAALGAMKVGEFSLAWEITFSSIKLQAAQSANSIYSNFKAAIAASVEFIGVAFGPGSGIFTVLTQAFTAVGHVFSRSILEALKTVGNALGTIFDGPMGKLLEVVSPVSAKLIEGFTKMGNVFDGAITDMDAKVATASNTMKNAMGQIPGDFTLAAQEAKKAFEKSLKSAGQLIDTTGMELDLQNKKTEALTLQNEKAQEALKNAGDFVDLEIKIGGERVTNAQRIKELESEIASAKAQGNKELEAQLIAQKAYYEQLERALAAGKDQQTAITEASKAYNVSLEKSVADAGKLAKTKEKIKDDMEQIKTIGDLIAKTNVAAPMKTFGEKIKVARKDLKDLKDFVGGDFSRMSVPDIAKKLGIATAKKTSKELLDEIQKKMDEIKKRPIDLRVDKEATKEDLKVIQKEIANMDAKKTLTLDADTSIASVRSQMSQEIDLGLSSSKGTSMLGTLTAAVEEIKRLVTLIEPKLPTSALGV